jgi:hypothetical protein
MGPAWISAFRRQLLESPVFTDSGIGTASEKIICLLMFAQLILPALLIIAVSSFILRIVIGYLVRPPRVDVAWRRFLMVQPRWLGRRAAELLYRRKSKRRSK